MPAEPERRPAALLYVELRNFTRLSAMLQPHKVLELANEFFSFASRAVIAGAGNVVSVHNDSLLASFVEGDTRKFNEAALGTARAIRGEFGPVGERWQRDYGLAAAVSLGLHTGEAVFGMAGPLGAQQFVAFGDCVSIAERLVHRARAGEIVISFDVMKALGAAVETLGAEELPALELGGKRRPLPIYGLVLETRLDFT
ncbi:MAG TPA: adenylate/guanylate cyclase domain-containing protein [Burkholderiales bacterium]|nr:adenylate/guanylate cyclase domain-containing protein [Burkholderiales bacterium]